MPIYKKKLEIPVNSIVLENFCTGTLNSENSFKKATIFLFFFQQYLFFSTKTFLSFQKIFYFCRARRDGRVVDCGGLENRCTERYRGFESLSLRSLIH